MSTFLQILFNSLEAGGYYALAALGIIIIFRTSRMTNFAQGTIGTFNAFTATVAAMRFDLTAPVAALLGMLAAVVSGVLIDFIIIRRAQKVSPLAKQIITFGLIMVILGITPLIFGSLPLSFGQFIDSGKLVIGAAFVTHNALLNIATGVILMLILFYFLQKTRWGLGVRATASAEHTAQLLGIPTQAITMGAWAIAAALATLSALMLAPAITVNVSMMNNVQIIALIACVLGGFQTFYGPVLGAYIIAISKNLLLIYFSSTWGEPALYALILLFIIFKPQGLIGKKVIKKV